MGRKDKKWSVLVMLAVIIPGLIIGLVGIYLVSQQKNARLPMVRQEYFNRLTILRHTVETTTKEQLEKACQHMESNSPNLTATATLQESIKTLLLRFPMVKYPFLISTTTGFLFPLSQKAQLPLTSSPVLNPETQITDKKTKQFYKQGYDAEYQQKNFTAAIKAYLFCLETNFTGAVAVKPYILNAIARCYAKLYFFPQAITYYKRILTLPGERVKKDPFLYFTVLRHLAVSYRQMGYTEEAVQWYLQLYEESPRGDNASEPGPFLFYKNEALDYLNRFNHETGKSEDVSTPVSRFSRAKAKDRLEKASELDIDLQWFYFDTEVADEGEITRKETDGKESRFFKLRELYESDDEKTQFYHLLDATEFGAVKINGAKESKESAIVIRRLERRMGKQGVDICYKPIIKNHPRLGTVYFGFMLSFQYVQQELLPSLVQQEFSGSNLFVEAHENQKNGLLSVPFLSMFKGNRLTLFSLQPDYFETIVVREIRLYYGLWGALVIVLGLGIVVFYKYVAREAQLVRLKAEFVDSVSHTLKTPLTRISLLAENVAQGWVTGEAQKKEFFGSIVWETARMSEMIDNMLNFSRIEAGKEHFEPESLYLQEQVAEIVAGYVQYASNHGFQLEVDLEKTVPQVFVDSKALKLILGNLLQNAFKYSLTEKVVRVRVFREKEAGVIEVADRGMGIEMKYLPLLFKKFSRVPDPRVSAIEGSGLGLFLVRFAVTAHRGKIVVNSTLHQGTTFKITFPLVTEVQK